jgi:hypothetical protein
MSSSSLQNHAYFLDDDSIQDNLAHLGVPDLSPHCPVLSHGLEPSIASLRQHVRSSMASRTAPGAVAYRYAPIMAARGQNPRILRPEFEALHPFVGQEEIPTQPEGVICFVDQTLVSLDEAAPHLQDVHWSRQLSLSTTVAGCPQDCAHPSNSPVSCVIPQQSAITSPPPLTIQVMPDMHLTLHGAAETHLAIADGLYGPVQCLDCESNLFCILKASLVLCPTCRAIGPSGLENVDQSVGIDDGVDSCAAESSIGLGFTMSDLMEYLSEA